MAFTTDQFTRTRPYLFHLTDRDNVSYIRDLRVLHSAAVLMQKAGDRSYLRQKRRTAIQIAIDHRLVSIRDQRPLHAGNIRFHGGHEFEDVIQLLNERVFFWPGTVDGPIAYGQRHFERYADDQPVILRVSTANLFNANNGASPFYCRYNSGSPRCSKGLGSPRGPDTFVTAASANFTAGKAVEVTFLGQVTLPAQVKISNSVFGPWRSL